MAANLALLAAAGLALAAVARPAAWTPAILGAPPLRDPRLAGSLALAVAASVAVLALLGTVRRVGGNPMAVVVAGGIGAAICAAAAAFLGLRGSLPVTAVAIGGFAVLSALTAIGPARRDPDVRRMPALALGAGLVAIGAAASVCGARSDVITLPRGAAVDTLGYTLAYAGGADAPRLDLMLTRGRFHLSASPPLPADRNLQPPRSAHGGRFSGPLLFLDGVLASQSAPHKIVWLAKGDSTRIGAVSLRFQKFRIEGGSPVKIYADLEATRDGRSRIVSPVVHASSLGEDPQPAVVEGLGSVMVAKIDADQGRVALLVPDTSPAPAAPAAALVSLALRPGLELAWAGFAIAALALLLPLPAARRNAT